MRLFTILTLIAYFPVVTGQIIIEGTILDNEEQPLAGANIFIKGTYYGATSDEQGKYNINIPEQDTVRLMASYMGYRNQEQMFVHQKNIVCHFMLEESANEMDELVITAGTFSAGDRQRAGKMNPLDIVTIASAEADIYAALSTLPGAQVQGETGKIIVRGGESYETKTFMDGLLVASPYGSSMPDMPARGRFSPFLFNGVAFSTGGYSAEYGQALSSVLELNSTALAEENINSISLMNVGIGASHTKRTKNASYTLEGNYMNTWPYFQMADHDIDWVKYPESINFNGRYRIKTGINGMLKSFVNYDKSYSSLRETDPFTGETYQIKLSNNNTFAKTSYAAAPNEKWMLKTGVAFNIDNNHLMYRGTDISEQIQSMHTRAGLTHFLTKNITLKGGLEYFYLTRETDIYDEQSQQQHTFFVTDHLLTSFVESDIKLSRKIAFRVGGRLEHSTILNKTNVVPRTSMAYKISDNSQVSAAYGQFRQNPHSDYLMYSKELDFEQSEHIIFNYQYEKNNRLLRMEIFRKNYSHLITYEKDTIDMFSNINSHGNGYAQGFDIFWRDRNTIPFLDYWISYAFIDTKRMYKDYPVKAIPEFVAAHSFSAIAKYWVNSIRSQFSLSYNFKSGRPYFNPAAADFHSDYTKPYHDISGSISYLTNIFDQFTVVYLSFTNLAGFDNVYGYRFYSESDETGSYPSYAIKPETKRTVIIGVFISFD